MWSAVNRAPALACADATCLNGTSALLPFPARMPSLFVSYRREDSAGFAGRLTDALETRFGFGSVFRDVDDIEPGADFEAAISRCLQQVQAVLVVIGPRWLSATADGQLRLERADDFVRREIEHALASGKPVVPVLVGGAAMPAAEALPASIRALAARHALALNDASWQADLARLESVLSNWLDEGRTRQRRRWLLGAAIAVIAAAVLTYVLRPNDDDAGLRVFEGRWQAEVAYPWGVTQREGFEFAVRDGAVAGRAGFLGVARTVEQAEWRGGRLHFVTRSAALSGNDPPRELVHRYEAEPAGEVLLIRLETRGGDHAAPAVEFVAHRREGEP